MSRALRGAAVALSMGLCLAGIGTVTRGVAVPVKAAVAQQSLDAEFEQRLAENLDVRRPPLSVIPAKAGTQLPAPMPRFPRKTIADVVRPLPSQGAIGRLTVDRLGIKDVILAGEATHDQLARGPTMLKHGDAESPVTILAAHRDTHFRFIRDLRVGDEMSLQSVTGEVVRYRISRFETVRWDRFAYPRDPARPLLALTTCYPFDGTEYGGPWRRIAWAEQVRLEPSSSAPDASS